MSESIYQVVIVSRYTGRESVQYSGASAIDATDTYEMIMKSQTTMKQFRVVLRRLEPVIVMESE